MNTMKKITAIFMFIAIMVLAPMGLAKEISTDVAGHYGPTACDMYQEKVDTMVENQELNGAKYVYLIAKIKENKENCTKGTL